MNESESVPPPDQAGPIAVYGATGYTGRLVAAELGRRGADFLLAGRSPGRLEALADRFEGKVQWRAVAADDADGLRSLFAESASVIACAGPFAEVGGDVVAAAAEAGCHYVDTSGEQTFMKMVFDRHDDAAKASGAALVSGMGFDFAPGDLIASLTAEGLEDIEEVTVAYWTRGFGMKRGGATRGTMRTTIAGLSEPWIVYRDGDWRAAESGVDGGIWDFPEPVGRQRMIRYPAGEQVTVPRHVRTRSVRTLFSAVTFAPHARLAATVPASFAALSAAMRTPLRRAVKSLVGHLPEGPSEEARAASRFLVVCEARGPSGIRRGVVRGGDVYGLTAFCVAEAALAMAAPGYERSGALAPSQAFDARAFLAALGGYGVTYELDA